MKTRDPPPPDVARWTARRKLDVVQAIKDGRLDRELALRCYNLSAAELASWERLADQAGMPALRITRLQKYRTEEDEMRVHQHARQGEASHKEVHRDSGPARGPVSPLGGSGGPAETVLHRDEDFASAPMERLPKGTIPEVNRRAGVTTIRGQHGPTGTPREQGKSGEVT